MLKITETRENGSALRLRLDGTISSESLQELAELFRRCRAGGNGPVIIDMTGVSFMGHEAARQIAAMRSDDLRIINCSPFIAALLESAKAPE